MRGAVGAVTAMLVFCAAALARGAPAVPAAPDAGPYARPAELVPVTGGRRLNLICLGRGEPTVILEAGAGNDATVWRKVQPKIAAFTRVCAYDRAGYGYSDPADRPSTAANIVEDLHRMLAVEGIRPVVLVGHSAGGLYATLYADQHRPEVAGLVLVDPLFAGMRARFEAAMTEDERKARDPIQQAYRERIGACANLARTGRMAEMAAKGCAPLPADLSPGLRQAMAALYAKPGYYDALLSEEAAYNGRSGIPSDDDRQESAAALLSFDDMPMLVLSAGSGVAAQGLSAATQAKLTALSRGGHAELAARSTRGKAVVVPGAGHMIQLDQPDAVVAAVAEVLQAARANP